MDSNLLQDDTLTIIPRPSPNHDARVKPVDMLVLHYTGMQDAQSAVSRLCDPEARVSAHYTVDETGRIYAHVPEARRAWHAGVSWWAGERDINGSSVGIEIVNPGHEFGYRPFPDPQIAAIIDLASAIMERHGIAPARVLGHSDVAPARKQDPGELFPWKRLADFGIGIWPFDGRRADRARPTEAEPPTPEDCAQDADRLVAERERAFLDRLRQVGYGVPPDMDVTLTQLVSAFQRHWRPERVDGLIDVETAYRLGRLVEALS